VPASDGSLGGVLTALDVNGVATFSGAVADLKTGTYTLTVTDGALPAANVDLIVYPGAASKLVVTELPSGTAGQALTLVVEQEDSGGDLVSTVFQVGLQLGTAPAGASYGRQSVPSNGGYATFNDIVLTKAGTYTMVANAQTPGVSAVTSAPFVVNNAALSKVVFTTQPVNMAQGTMPAVVVTLEDTYGNVVSTGVSKSDVVTISLESGVSGATIGGTTKVAANNGVATFTNLSLLTQGEYSLKATAGGKSVNSNSFFVQTKTPSKLVFTVEPPATGYVLGSPLNVQVTVENTYGDRIISGVSTVTLALTNLTSSAHGSLAGAITAKTVNGVATFSTANVLAASGGSYTLKATDAAITGASAVSTKFTATYKTVFTELPTTLTNGTLQVAIENAANTVITGDSSSVITLAIAANPGYNYAPSFNTSGTTSLTAAAVNGVATFNMSIVNTHSGAPYPDVATYTFKASSSDPSVPNATSTPDAFGQIAFVTNGISNNPTNTTVKVEMQDGYSGDGIQQDKNGDVVTLAISASSGTLGAPTLTGTTTAVIANGLATFTVNETYSGGADTGTYTFTATTSDPTVLAGTSKATAITA